jgi:cytochrome oxidase Cu insertion factor (SCO1/SenC/PrrC family)
MNSFFKNFNRKLWAIALLAAASATVAQVKMPAANAPALALTGSLENGAAFDIAKSRGKVVMVFFWSTKCSVCLNHMPELRANLAGWKGKPFELVTVNVDNDMTDWKTYEQIAAKIERVRPTAIWNNTSVSPRLPLTLVLNTKGQVISRHEGRIAPEAWDDVAEVLP